MTTAEKSAEMISAESKEEIATPSVGVISVKKMVPNTLSEDDEVSVDV